MAKFVVNGELTQSIGIKGEIYFAGKEVPVGDIDREALDQLVAGKYIVEVKESKKGATADSKTMNPNTGDVTY